ncbi:MAG: coproporphyrinogen III oxidase family protein, partial [Clostridia bacterium]|nr:coproporphyrinogen III oxidase family protein [Clostridia bacterium]
MLGLYIHIPFCANKCEYCDFYSINYNTKIVENYVEEVCRRLNNIDFVFDTVYFGGGTPSL